MMKSQDNRDDNGYDPVLASSPNELMVFLLFTNK